MYILIYSYSITARKVCHKGPLRPGFRRRRVLRLTGPTGRRVLRFDSTFVAEGCGIALSGDIYKVSVAGLVFVSPMSHGKEQEPLPKEGAIYCRKAATKTLSRQRRLSNLRPLGPDGPISPHARRACQPFILPGWCRNFLPPA